jgi:hypothetical protein
MQDSGSWLDRLLKGVSLLGLVALVFLAGAIAGYFQAFPYPIIRDGVIAGKAWLELVRGRPATFTRFAGSAVASPTGPAAAPGGAGEPVLVGGGPYENLTVCPTHGCLAWIVDRQGRILHTWEIDPQPILDGMQGYEGEISAKRLKPHDWHLQANGDLTVIFENNGAFPYGGAVARFDWDGKLLWVTHNGAHHWMTIDDAGTMYMPINRGVASPLPFGDGRLAYTCEEGGIERDLVQLVDAQGRPGETIDMLQVLLEGGFEGLLWMTVNQCDPLHLNFVQYVDADLARRSGLEAGDLIVSFRHISAVAVLAAGDRHVKWLLTGQILHQHSPRIAPDGGLLIFDNFGGLAARGSSKVVRVRIGTQMVEDVFIPDADDAGAFFSPFGGLIEQHPTGTRALLTLTDPGRIVEVDLATRAVLWDYVKQFPSEGYPRADPGKPGQRFVHVEAYGGYYITEPAILRRLGRSIEGG